MNDIINGLLKKKKTGNFRQQRNFVYLRWVALLLVIPLFFLVSDCPRTEKVSGLPFQWQFCIMDFNFAHFIQASERLGKEIHKHCLLFDIMFICAFSYILNGIESDIYILIFFVISYYGIGKDVSSTINISILA